MKNFEFAAPRTEAEVLPLLSSQPGRTEVLAGGTDLVGLMKKMIVTPERVVNIMEIPSLKVIEPTEDGGVSIGAAVTLDDIVAHPHLEPYPAVTDAILGINSMQLQAQGTLGGELCQRPRCWFYRNGQSLLDGDAVESGDNRFHAIFANGGRAKFVHSSRVAPALIALGAALRIVGPGEEERLIPVADFFRVPRNEEQREHVLTPDQLLTHIVLPPTSLANATYEVRTGEGPEYPLASAACALDVDSDGLVRSARVVLGQVAPTPWVSQLAEKTLVGRGLDEVAAEAAAAASVEDATPLSQNAYKVQLTKVSVKRAVLRAAGLETGGF